MFTLLSIAVVAISISNGCLWLVVLSEKYGKRTNSR